MGCLSSIELKFSCFGQFLSYFDQFLTCLAINTERKTELRHFGRILGHFSIQNTYSLAEMGYLSCFPLTLASNLD